MNEASVCHLQEAGSLQCPPPPCVLWVPAPHSSLPSLGAGRWATSALVGGHFQNPVLKGEPQPLPLLADLGPSHPVAPWAPETAKGFRSQTREAAASCIPWLIPNSPHVVAATGASLWLNNPRV